jgi:hypothetical protein
MDAIDAQSDQSDIIEHVVMLDDPEKLKDDKNNFKIAFKTHIDIENKDEINEIILLINQIVGEIYQFVFVIEHS